MKYSPASALTPMPATTIAVPRSTDARRDHAVRTTATVSAIAIAPSACPVVCSTSTAMISALLPQTAAIASGAVNPPPTADCSNNAHHITAMAAIAPSQTLHAGNPTSG